MTTTQAAPPANTQRRQLPALIAVLTAGTFLMGTSEFVVAGLLPEIAAEFTTSISHAGLTITVFAIGMIVGAPGMALLTLRLPKRLTLTLALAVFALGHVVVAVTDDFSTMLVARFVTALATGTFWSLASGVAAAAAGPTASSRALGIVLGGGMLANVLGVPVGAFAGQLIGWRGAFWGLAVLAALAAVAVALLVPAEPVRRAGAAGAAALTGAAPAVASVRAELAALRSGRLWLTLASCALVTGGVLSIYSYISPLLTERAGLPASTVPVALLMFGVGALLGTIVCGRLGDAHPYRTALSCAALTLFAAVGLWVSAGSPIATLACFALLGLVGLSANPILVALAVRFGDTAPTLATAMPTSIFNLGTAIGTGISAATLHTGVGALGPVIVGACAAALLFVPLGILAARDR